MLGRVNSQGTITMATMRRYSLTLPSDLIQKIMIECAHEGVRMGAALRELVVREYADLPDRPKPTKTRRSVEREKASA